MPFKAGQEAKAFKALMSAARQLELDLEFVTSNSSAVSEFDYGEVDFEEGLDQISRLGLLQWQGETCESCV